LMSNPHWGISIAQRSDNSVVRAASPERSLRNTGGSAAGSVSCAVSVTGGPRTIGRA